MRLPLSFDLDSRDGVDDSDSRLTNVLKEVVEGGELVVLRPGLNRLSATSGDGNGLVNFNDTLISVYGASICVETTSIQTLSDNFFDFTQSTQ